MVISLNSPLPNRPECVFKNGWGQEYIDFSCQYPLLEKTYYSWEKGFDPEPVQNWMVNHPQLPILTVILYGVLIIFGLKIMEERQAWRSRWFLAAWNLFLSVYSFIGMFRTIPTLFHNMFTMSLRDNICQQVEVTFGSGSTGLWIFLFIISKFPELFDTFFIVVNKKRLIFLHWYHHITVLLYCWHSYATKCPTGPFFVVMNYSVHAFMYFYYFLTAVKLKPRWIHPMYITTLQLSQMLVGVAITIFSFYYYLTDDKCGITYENNVAAFLMYGSYFVLFLQFFVGRYFKARVTDISSKKKI